MLFNKEFLDKVQNTCGSCTLLDSYMEKGMSFHDAVLKIANSIEDKLIGNEITKLRREVYDLYESSLCQQYCPNDYKIAWNYFMAMPLTRSFNRTSLEMLVEACECAKQRRERLNLSELIT